MEKDEYLLDEDELVGRATKGRAEANDHGGPEDDRVVAGTEDVNKGAGEQGREDEVEAKSIDGEQRGEAREDVRRGREWERPGRDGREGHGFGMRMPSKRTKLAVAMVALGFVGVVGFWWAHGRAEHGRAEVARGTNAGGSSEAMAGLPPELAKVLRPGHAVAIRHSAPPPVVPVAPVVTAGGTPIVGRHRIAARAPAGVPKPGVFTNRKVVAPVAEAAILAKPGNPLAPVGIPAPAPVSGSPPANGKALAGSKALLAGESSRGGTSAPAVRNSTIPAKDTVLEEIRSLKAEMAGVKAALANERKAVGVLPAMDKRLVVLHGALEKLLKNAEAGSRAHAKVRSGKKGKAHAGSRRVKRVMGYRLLAVVGDQAVVEDMGTGRVRVLRANGRLGGLVVYQVAGGAVVTNYGVMGGNNE